MPEWLKTVLPILMVLGGLASVLNMVAFKNPVREKFADEDLAWKRRMARRGLIGGVAAFIISAPVFYALEYIGVLQ